MGGFSGISSAISDTLSKGLGHAATILEHTQSVDHIFEKTPEGKAFGERLKNVYFPTKAMVTEDLSKQAIERAKLDPTAPPINPGEIHSQAAKAARFKALGPKDVLGVMTASAIEKKHGLLAAQSFSNAVAFVLKDYVDPMATRGDAETAARTRRGAPYSSFKDNVAKAGVPLTSIEPSYRPATPLEKAVRSAIYSSFAPLIAIPHVATTFNGLFGADPYTFIGGLAKASTKSLSAGIDDFQGLLTTGVFAETHLRDVYEWNRFKATGHPEFSGSGVAHLAYKLFHQPGFSALRDYTLLSGANVGKMTAEQLGRDFIKNPNSAKLRWQLGELGLDPKKILAQNGALDQSDLSTAVYRFVDKHYFLDNTLQRSMFLQSTWQGRILGTFHGYVTRQSKLMAKAMIGDIKNQGALNTVKNLAVGGILLPALGEGIKVIQESYRGQKNTLQGDIQNLKGEHGVANQLETYGEMLGHVGAFGVYTHIIRGAYTHNILNTMAGPVLSGPADILQDTASGIRKTALKKGSSKQENFAPLERDLLFDTPGLNVLGQALSHRLIPTKKDQNDGVKPIYDYLRSEDSTNNSNQKTKEKF